MIDRLDDFERESKKCCKAALTSLFANKAKRRNEAVRKSVCMRVSASVCGSQCCARCI